MLILLIAQALSYQFMCGFDPSLMCESFQMIVGPGTSAFIEPKFKNAKDSAMCQGRWVKGTIRYMVTGTAPSSIVGTIFPQKVEEGKAPVDPSGTLEIEGDVILLYMKDQILKFKATQANWAEAELTWECSL